MRVVVLRVLGVLRPWILVDDALLAAAHVLVGAHFGQRMAQMLLCRQLEAVLVHHHFQPWLPWRAVGVLGVHEDGRRDGDTRSRLERPSWPGSAP